jgi:hypothetical protein
MWWSRSCHVLWRVLLFLSNFLGKKAWLMIVNNIHEVVLGFIVNSLLNFTLWCFVMTSLVMRFVVYGGHDSKSNLRVSCTKRQKKNWRRKEVKYQKTWYDMEMWPWISWAIVKGKVKNVQWYFIESYHHPLQMDATTSRFGVLEVVWSVRFYVLISKPKIFVWVLCGCAMCANKDRDD